MPTTPSGPSSSSAPFTPPASTAYDVVQRLSSPGDPSRWQTGRGTLSYPREMVLPRVRHQRANLAWATSTINMLPSPPWVCDLVDDHARDTYDICELMDLGERTTLPLHGQRSLTRKRSILRHGARSGQVNRVRIEDEANVSDCQSLAPSEDDGVAACLGDAWESGDESNPPSHARNGMDASSPRTQCPPTVSPRL